MSDLGAFLAELTEVSRRHGLKLALEYRVGGEVIVAVGLEPGNPGRYRHDPALGVHWGDWADAAGGE